VYTENSILKRGEMLRNAACALVSKHGDEDNAIKYKSLQLLHDSMVDTCSGLLELFDAPYCKGWPLSRYIQAIREFVPELSHITGTMTDAEYDTLLSTADNEIWSKVSLISKNLMYEAARFGGAGIGSSQYVLAIMRLAERYPDTLIEAALYTKSDEPGLDELYGWPEEQKDKAINILIKRYETRLEVARK
jgi:hypothetical protein